MVQMMIKSIWCGLSNVDTTSCLLTLSVFQQESTPIDDPAVPSTNERASSFPARGDATNA